MIFVIIIAHAAHKSQHNFRFFRPAAADERLPLTRELSAKLTEGEKTLDFCIALKKCKPSGLLSLRQNLRFCHLPRQREALDPRIPKASPMRGRHRVLAGRSMCTPSALPHPILIKLFPQRVFRDRERAEHRDELDEHGDSPDISDRLRTSPNHEQHWNDRQR